VTIKDGRFLIEIMHKVKRIEPSTHTLILINVVYLIPENNVAINQMINYDLNVISRDYKMDFKLIFMEKAMTHYWFHVH